jgi:transposase-like protein
MTIKTSEEAIMAFLTDIPQSKSELARKVGINRSNITGWLRKLQVKGLAKEINGQWIGTQQPQQQPQQVKPTQRERTFSDAVKYYSVHLANFPDKPTTKLLGDIIDEIDSMINRNVEANDKINKFYDLLGDIYYNRVGADYSRGLLRDGYIDSGLSIPPYAQLKLQVDKYDDIPENDEKEDNC